MPLPDHLPYLTNTPFSLEARLDAAGIKADFTPRHEAVFRKTLELRESVNTCKLRGVRDPHGPRPQFP
jgi:hypothetical protein